MVGDMGLGYRMEEQQQTAVRTHHRFRVSIRMWTMVDIDGEEDVDYITGPGWTAFARARTNVRRGGVSEPFQRSRPTLSSASSKCSSVEVSPSPPKSHPSLQKNRSAMQPSKLPSLTSPILTPPKLCSRPVSFAGPSPTP